LYLLAALRAGERDPSEWLELVGQVADSGCFSLQASGTLSPAWEVYLSAPLTAEETQLDSTYAAKHASGVRFIRAALDGSTEWPPLTNFPFGCEDDAAPTPVSDAFVGTGPHMRTVGPRPIGIPAEVACAGVLTAPPVVFHSPRDTVSGLDERTLDWVLKTAQEIAGGRPPVLVGADEQEVVIDQRYESALAGLSSRSTALLGELLLDAPSLRCSFRHPEAWLGSRPVTWEALDWASDSWVPIDQLSRAEARWAAVAIHLAMTEAETLQPKVVLFDEPEGALHRSAEIALVHGLCRLTGEDSPVANAFVVATHSPAFLSHAQVSPVHVARDADGFTEASELGVALRGEMERGLATAALGLSPSDLMQMIRVLVLVEGKHDETVLDALFGDVLTRCRAYLVPLRGGSHLRSALNAAMLFDFTDAAVAIVLDNDPAGEIGRIWDEALGHAAISNSAAAVRCLSRLERLPFEAASWLRELGDRALRSHQ
ncbi:MAG: hypothetical protein LC777_08450, partial [Actinobacteria bacterium]|nr:hypothetical protein [Actinomycetota bacterium]